MGSGFVVQGKTELLVVTNQHVLAGATQILIMDNEGRVYDGEVLGADADLDLAVLRVPGLEGPALSLGNSRDLRVGDDVFAVGNPYGHGHTVTRGILSARARSLGRSRFDIFMQTDAAINPGSSGGPLFDTMGRVVGVNTAIDSRGEALGFAMPIELVAGSLNPLSRGEAVREGWAGMRLEEIRGGGLKVSAVYTKGPALRAGIAVGDEVVSVDGRPCASRAGWAEAFAAAFPGNQRQLVVRRQNREVKAVLTLRDRALWVEDVVGPPIQIPDYRVAVQGLPPDAAYQLGLKEGAQVESIQSGAFFRPGDIVLEINGQTIQSPADLAESAAQVLRRRSLVAIVARNGSKIRILRQW